MAPGFDQDDQVGRCFVEGLFEGGLAIGPVCAVAAPDVPRDQADRRLDQRAVRGVRVEAHLAGVLRSWRRRSRTSATVASAASTTPRKPAKPWMSPGPGTYWVGTPAAASRAA